jgi:uncharacterized protein (TIGR03067 family)
MITAIPVFVVGAVSVITAGCSTGELRDSTIQSADAQRDYERLSGTWQLTRGVVNGKPVLANVARNTTLITDHNTFRFPKASGVGTHPAGTFTVNPDTKPKQVDSFAEGEQNSHHLREAEGFFNIGRKLDRCLPVRNTPNFGSPIQPRHGQSDSNEIPLVSAHRHSSSVGLRSVAVFFILAIHSSTSVWRQHGADFTHGLPRY